MSDIVSPLLQWLNANPEWAGFATFVISAAESVAIIGTIVPGSITMTAVGALAGAGVIPLWATILWAICGAILGDGISYWIGHYFKGRLRNTWPFHNNPSILATGEAFVHKYGIMSVFIGRFVGPVRALVPLVAGMLGMKPLQFTIANITSAIGWAPVYMFPGIILGAASLELPPDIAAHVILVLLLILLFIVLCIWTLYKLFQLISQQTEQMLTNIWHALKKSRYFHLATVILKHHNPKQHYGQLTRAFYFLLTSMLLLCLIIYVKVVGSENILINNTLFHFFRGIRNEITDGIMIDITLLGQKQIILPVVLILFIWLLLSKHMRAAFHALALGILASGSVFIIKHLVQSPRPFGLIGSPESFSMPSGHATLATTVYMGIAFILASPTPRKHRWLIYTPAAIVAFVVGISRLYLGAHWFTDILAAWLLSAALLILIILSFHRQHEKPINLMRTSIVAIVALLVSYTIYYQQHINELSLRYALLNWPTAEISGIDWWQQNKGMPAERVSLFGFPSQYINIEWAGNIKQIRKVLSHAGWAAPPVRDWVSTLHRITDIQSSEYLPMVSPQYLDKKPILILAKRINNGKKLLVLRLWSANRFIQGTVTPIWVGTIGIVPRAYSWLLPKHAIDFKLDGNLVLGSATTHWQWKTITLIQIVHDNKTVMQKILLVKENN